MRYVTTKEMKEIDSSAINQHGVRASVLMENAGKAVAQEAMKMVKRGDIFVFSGYGNNGGDGFVAARHLIDNGYKVKIFVVGSPKPFSSETKTNYDALTTLNCKPEAISNMEEMRAIFNPLRRNPRGLPPTAASPGIGFRSCEIHAADRISASGRELRPCRLRRRGRKGSTNIKKPLLIIDSIFGIGIRGALGDFYIELIDRINALGSPIISVDIPSGLDADTGEPLGRAVKAAKTITLGFPKVGFKNSKANEYVGQLVVADIGLPLQLRISR